MANDTFIGSYSYRFNQLLIKKATPLPIQLRNSSGQSNLWTLFDIPVFRLRCNLRSAKWKTDWSRILLTRYSFKRRDNIFKRNDIRPCLFAPTRASPYVPVFITKIISVRWVLLRRRLRSWGESLRLPKIQGVPKATTSDCKTRAGVAGAFFLQLVRILMFLETLLVKYKIRGKRQPLSSETSK